MHKTRRPLIAGNWKMNEGGGSAMALAHEVARLTSPLDRVDVVVAPPFTAIAAVACEIQKGRVTVAAQNLYPKDAGAFTGEVSAPMLLEAGASWVILGHSERRHVFGETDDLIAKKVAYAIEKDLRPIACVGETLEEREAGKTLEVVRKQLDAFLPSFTERPGYGVIAYEPVWAIGTGKVAGPEQAQEVHAMIRERLRSVSPDLAEKTLILYGGSVKADNAASLLACDDVDGALVGGAALEPVGFAEIAAAAQARAKELG